MKKFLMITLFVVPAFMIGMEQKRERRELMPEEIQAQAARRAEKQALAEKHEKNRWEVKRQRALVTLRDNKYVELLKDRYYDALNDINASQALIQAVTEEIRKAVKPRRDGKQAQREAYFARMKRLEEEAAAANKQDAQAESSGF